MTRDEYRLNREGLKQRQSLPLEAKIHMTEERVRQFIEEMDGNCYISFSGGKDSTVLRHIIYNSYIIITPPNVYSLIQVWNTLRYVLS